MMPFLCEAVEKFMRRLMNMCVHKSVLHKAATGFYLNKIDLNDKANLLLPKDLKLPVATAHALSNQKINDTQKLSFKTDCLNALVALLQKLQERSPLKYVLARSFSCTGGPSSTSASPPMGISVRDTSGTP